MISLKYKIIDEKSIQTLTREELLSLIKSYLKKKLNIYGKNKNEIKNVFLNRSYSSNGKLENINQNKNFRRSKYQRRLSQPITRIEKLEADDTIKRNEIKMDSQNIVQKEVYSHNPNYDKVGMYPPVKKLIAIGDVHGDLRVTLIALKLAEVIPQNSHEDDIDNIHWIGGSTWIIQLGDQIDRCRPDELEKNCIKDFSDVFQDEGNNIKIIKLFLKLDDEARKEGGRVLGLLGNHELMNVDKDFRYVSPKEFLEFVPMNDQKFTYTNDGYPLGYYHRTKAFERGGNIAKLYASRKKSIMIIGNILFVHGGLSIDLVNKYSISEINQIVSKWLVKQTNQTEDDMFDHIFRDDDDMSPFWCRIYGEDDNDENTERSFNELLMNINRKNKLLQPIQRIVIAHTPQFMDNKYLNSIYNNRLWRIDVGMSRAFGEHDVCREDKYRQIQILVIHENERFEIRKKPFNSERYPSEGIGTKVDLLNERMY